MSYQNCVWIGADPGGMGNFGLAILQEDCSVCTWCVNCADEAVGIVFNEASYVPAGVGVDAPLWWSSGLSSDRYADQWLRRRYGLPGGTVQTANSLRGAALVQGAMFVHLIRQQFPGVPVTETHPKAVLAALYNASWSDFSNRFGIRTSNAIQEHERDAIISAVAAREGFEGRWNNDLSLIRYLSEQDPSEYWLAPIHYFWPEI